MHLSIQTHYDEPAAVGAGCVEGHVEAASERQRWGAQQPWGSVGSSTRVAAAGAAALATAAALRTAPCPWLLSDRTGDARALVQGHIGKEVALFVANMKRGPPPARLAGGTGRQLLIDIRECGY